MFLADICSATSVTIFVWISKLIYWCVSKCLSKLIYWCVSKCLSNTIYCYFSKFLHTTFNCTAIMCTRLFVLLQVGQILLCLGVHAVLFRHYATSHHLQHSFRIPCSISQYITSILWIQGSLQSATVLRIKSDRQRQEK